MGRGEATPGSAPDSLYIPLLGFLCFCFFYVDLAKLLANIEFLKPFLILKLSTNLYFFVSSVHYYISTYLIFILLNYSYLLF